MLEYASQPRWLPMQITATLRALVDLIFVTIRFDVVYGINFAQAATGPLTGGATELQQALFRTR
jgi:hypothetical protein